MPPDRINLGPASELPVDCEEDRTLRAVLVGMLREADGGRASCQPDSTPKNMELIAVSTVCIPFKRVTQQSGRNVQAVIRWEEFHG